jgi:hypothetical protein
LRRHSPVPWQWTRSTWTYSDVEVGEIATDQQGAAQCQRGLELGRNEIDRRKLPHQ